MCWENPRQENQAARDSVRVAIENSWEKVSLVDFVGWEKCSRNSKGIRIQIKDEGPHVKKLGSELDGKENGMVLNFTYQNWGCDSLPCSFPDKGYSIDDFNRIIAIHEFGHALGFAHEQNRDDTPDWCDQEQGSDGDFPIGFWDLESVMNYCNPIWGGDGNLSPIDIAGVQIIYGAEPWSKYENDYGRLYLGDFDGDGLTDIMRQINRYGGGEVMLSNGFGFEQPEKWTSHGFKGRTWYVGDFNGDNKDDLIRVANEHGGAEVLLSTGTSFSSASRWTAHGYNNGGWYVGDFNGDGKDDLLRRKNKYGGADVILSTGSGFLSAKKWTGHGWGGRRGKWFIGDFNGDGKDDLLRRKNKHGGADVILSTGTDFLSAKRWTNHGWGRFRTWFIGDFNGDGKDDLARDLNEDFNFSEGFNVILSLGNTFKSGERWSLLGPRFNSEYIGDFNGDGKDDLLYPQKRNNRWIGVEVQLSDGNEFNR